MLPIASADEIISIHTIVFEGNYGGFEINTGQISSAGFKIDTEKTNSIQQKSN
jgi:hypothetical protein